MPTARFLAESATARGRAGRLLTLRHHLDVSRALAPPVSGSLASRDVLQRRGLSNARCRCRCVSCVPVPAVAVPRAARRTSSLGLASGLMPRSFLNGIRHAIPKWVPILEWRSSFLHSNSNAPERYNSPRILESGECETECECHVSRICV